MTRERMQDSGAGEAATRESLQAIRDRAAGIFTDHLGTQHCIIPELSAEGVSCTIQSITRKQREELGLEESFQQDKEIPFPELRLLHEAPSVFHLGIRSAVFHNIPLPRDNDKVRFYDMWNGKQAETSSQSMLWGFATMTAVNPYDENSDKYYPMNIGFVDDTERPGYCIPFIIAKSEGLPIDSVTRGAIKYVLTGYEGLGFLEEPADNTKKWGLLQAVFTDYWKNRREEALTEEKEAIDKIRTIYLVRVVFNPKRSEEKKWKKKFNELQKRIERFERTFLEEDMTQIHAVVQTVVAEVESDDNIASLQSLCAILAKYLYHTYPTTAAYQAKIRDEGRRLLREKGVAVPEVPVREVNKKSKRVERTAFSEKDFWREEYFSVQLVNPEQTYEAVVDDITNGNLGHIIASSPESIGLFEEYTVWCRPESGESGQFSLLGVLQLYDALSGSSSEGFFSSGKLKTIGEALVEYGLQYTLEKRTRADGIEENILRILPGGTVSKQDIFLEVNFGPALWKDFKKERKTRDEKKTSHMISMALQQLDDSRTAYSAPLLPDGKTFEEWLVFVGKATGILIASLSEAKGYGYGGHTMTIGGNSLQQIIPNN